jgi:hypothetical protein
VENQIFAQATSLRNLTQHCDELGILGLGFSDISSHEFPFVLSNLKGQLRDPVFSLHLNPNDDCPTSMVGGLLPGEKPISSSSEIMFGGANQDHYQDCLQWHDLGQFRVKQGEAFKGYWDFHLDGVQVGDEGKFSVHAFEVMRSGRSQQPVRLVGAEIESSNLALVDSGSTLLVGSREIVGRTVKKLGAQCLVLVDSQGGNFEEVECGDPSGFELAAVPCVGSLPPLKFIADGRTYTIDKADLLKQIDTSVGSIFLFKIVGAPGFPGWLLGDVFLKKHCTVFDFGNKRMGFAQCVEMDHGRCDADSHLDIKNMSSNAADRSSEKTVQ